ncbi:methyltransferase domain-containing protein [Streptomyces sp. RPA4-5]|uniref:methyltransferase domain-containing protein n=1 Tax=Streptomyces TaxID=1883 RepID=UPI00143E203A|nr:MULTISPECIES: methyltransferase domain-containing protein [Streptomyces]MCX4636813.1 methyltransferase domain-containing protein [Streptomyces platensis]QIY57095.1 methyltransferase domain-containing protein [Streptomyces sp. RPA4-5]
MTTQQRLVEALRSKGALPLMWQDTVASVDRALFIPEAFERHDFAADPEGWRKAVYTDAPVVTQVNEGKPTSDGEFRLFTSSSSMPSIMLEMLSLLDVQEGQRVLEIGTGTGYHAAWLSHRLGENNVTTVEIDEAVLSAAVENLKRAGFHPTTILGNGREGHPRGAPYDRVICTCTVRDVPQAWLEQCPDGRIVTPWGSSFFSGSYATLDVRDGSAQGAFSGYPAFMWDRTQRAGAGRISDVYHAEKGEKSITDIPPQNVIQDDPAFFTGLRLTDAWYRWCDADDDSGEATLWVLADDRKSWATVEYVPDAEAYEVEQYGPRALWDEVRDAFLCWHDVGKPERSRFGLTVDHDGQRVWLDEPRSVIGKL